MGRLHRRVLHAAVLLLLLNSTLVEVAAAQTIKQGSNVFSVPDQPTHLHTANAVKNVEKAIVNLLKVHSKVKSDEEIDLGEASEVGRRYQDAYAVEYKKLGTFVFPMIMICTIVIMMDAIFDLISVSPCAELTAPEGWEIVQKMYDHHDPVVFHEATPVIVSNGPKPKLIPYTTYTRDKDGTLGMMIHKFENMANNENKDFDVKDDTILIGIACHDLSPIVKATGKPNRFHEPVTWPEDWGGKLNDFLADPDTVPASFMKFKKPIVFQFLQPKDNAHYCKSDNIAAAVRSRQTATEVTKEFLTAELENTTCTHEWGDEGTDTPLAFMRMFQHKVKDGVPKHELGPRRTTDYVIYKEFGNGKKFAPVWIFDALFAASIFSVPYFFTIFPMDRLYDSLMEKKKNDYLFKLVVTGASNGGDPNKGGPMFVTFLIDLVVPIFIVMFFTVIDRFISKTRLSKYASLKVVNQAVFKAVIILLCCTAPLRIFALGKDIYMSRYNRGMKSTVLGMSWLNHFLAVLFLCDALIKDLKIFFPNFMKLEGLIADENANVVLGLAGALQSIVDLISAAREGAGHSGYCTLFDLRTLLTDSMVFPSNPDASFTLTCSHLKTSIEVVMGLTKQYDPMGGVEVEDSDLIAVEGTQCILSCSATALPMSKLTQIVCEDNGVIGSGWSIGIDGSTILNHACSNEQVTGQSLIDEQIVEGTTSASSTAMVQPQTGMTNHGPAGLSDGRKPAVLATGRETYSYGAQAAEPRQSAHALTA